MRSLFLKLSFLSFALSELPGKIAGKKNRVIARIDIDLVAITNDPSPGPEPDSAVLAQNGLSLQKTYCRKKRKFKK